MKAIKGLLLAILVVGISFSCSEQIQKDENKISVSKTDKVEVYYFHYSRRCATCNAVESVSKETIADFYGDKVTFTSYNLDEEAGETKGKGLEVSGQTLLIVGSDTIIDITNEGFMNARNNPDKLKAIIKEKIDLLL